MILLMQRVIGALAAACRSLFSSPAGRGGRGVKPALLIFFLSLLPLSASAQSLGMLLRVGLVPGLGGSLLRLPVGPVTGGEGVDLAIVPAEGNAPGGLLVGSQWGDLIFYAEDPSGVYQPPEPWLGSGSAQWHWPPVPRQVSPELADWDGDGRLDLLLGWGSLLLWYRREEGSLGAGRQVEMTDGRRLAEAVRSENPQAGHLAPCAGDFDGDGRPDLLLGADDGSVWWCRNQAEAGFTPAEPQRVVSPTGPLRAAGGRARISLGDLTGDGRPDLLLGSARGDLCFYPSMPTGLGPAQPLVFAEPPASSLAGALSPRVAPAEGRVLLGEARGLVRAVEVSAGGRLIDRGYLLAKEVPLDLGPAAAIQVVDENGDGYPDLVAGEASGRVTVYRNAGASDWDLATGQPLRDGRGAPVIAEEGYAWPLLLDADGDRDLDLLLGTGRGQIELWLNQGGLIRGAPITAGAGPIQAAGPITVAAGDWNGDGKPDLFVGCRREPARSGEKVEVRWGQIAFFENEALGRVALPLFNKGTLLDVFWRKGNAGGTLGRLPDLGLFALAPLPAPRGLTRFLALGSEAAYLLDCENRPPQYPFLTLTVPGNSPPTGLLPALSSAWVTATPSGKPAQVLCALGEYGFVCVFSAEALGIR